MQKLKFGHQEQKELMDQDKDDIENCEDESENEMSYDLTPTNVVQQNSEKAKQMIAKMFTDENDTYDEHSDDEEIEEHLARQCISKQEVHNSSFISPLEADNSREVFNLIKKLNIAPQPKRRGKQPTSNLEILMVGRTAAVLQSHHFLVERQVVQSPVASSHRSVYRTYVFGPDDSDSSSRSCLSTSECNSIWIRRIPANPRKLSSAVHSQNQWQQEQVPRVMRVQVFLCLRSCVDLRLLPRNKSAAARKAVVLSQKVKLHPSSQRLNYQGGFPG